MRLDWITHLGGGGGWRRGALLIEMRGLFERSSLFHLAKSKVLVLHKELEYKVEKFKYKKLEVMQPRIENKSELPVGK